MVHTRPDLPHGHGELLERPPYAEWSALLETNLAHLAAEKTSIGGMTLARLRSEGRREALAEAAAYSRHIAVGLDDPPAEPRAIAMTGHQPELFHPGVWVKHFLLDRLCEETGAVGVDLVVDTDTYESVALTAPCLHPRVDRCSQALVLGDGSRTYFGSRVPSTDDIDAFCDGGADMLASLPAPSIARHFAEFCSCLRPSALEARNLGDLLTFTRRRYEEPTHTRYLELPVSRMAGTMSYLRFAAHLMLDAEKFAREHNSELAEYRIATKARSGAQPFPDLQTNDGRIEVPFWFIVDGLRAPAWVRREGDRLSVFAGDERVSEPAMDVDTLANALRVCPVLAPRALTLTMYARLVLSDLFIHGVGGGRYDAVTDGVIRRYLDVEPPRYTVASTTMYLPLGAHVVSEGEVVQARQRLHRFEHNPDSMLDQVEFDDPAERSETEHLAAEKRRLVEEIKVEGADKKALGARIREINTELGRLLEPVASTLREEVELLEGQLETSDVLTDRTYPYCLWSPFEVQDKVR